VAFPGQKILGEPPFDPQLIEEFWRAFSASAALDPAHRVDPRSQHAPHSRSRLQGGRPLAPRRRSSRG
jgi:hypothetical protein